MTRLFFGNKSGTGPVLKILKNDADNPLTTSITDYNRFLFDSETTKLSYIHDIRRLAYDPAYPAIDEGSWTYYYFPSGTDATTCTYSFTSEDTGAQIQKQRYFKEYFGFGYIPIVETRFGVDAGTYAGPSLDQNTGGLGYGVFKGRAGYICEGFVYYDPNVGADPREWVGGFFPASGSDPVLQTVFQLPARDDAVPDFSTTPVSGQQTLLISPTTARLALPGRTVASANVDHYIFHEDKIPAKIMAAGDVAVAFGGTAAIDTPLPMTKLTYMDFHVKRATDTDFYHPPYFDSNDPDQQMGFTYTVVDGSTSLTLTNTSDFAIVVRYVIFADSEQAPTTGGSNILYRANDGARDFAQIKRPGSSDAAPNLNDIMVDTRLAYMPIVKEGFLNWDATDFPINMGSDDKFLGDRKATVTFPNTSGFKPFVKAVVVFSNNVMARDVISYSGGVHDVMTGPSSNPWRGRCTCYSSLAHITATSVDFYMSGSNPYQYDSSGADFPDEPALGLRYYIFAIPSAL